MWAPDARHAAVSPPLAVLLVQQQGTERKKRSRGAGTRKLSIYNISQHCATGALHAAPLTPAMQCLQCRCGCGRSTPPPMPTSGPHPHLQQALWAAPLVASRSREQCGLCWEAGHRQAMPHKLDDQAPAVLRGAQQFEGFLAVRHS